jgi:hypothetical protein
VSIISFVSSFLSSRLLYRRNIIYIEPLHKAFSLSLSLFLLLCRREPALRRWGRPPIRSAFGFSNVHTSCALGRFFFIFLFSFSFFFFPPLPRVGGPMTRSLAVI